MEKTLQDLLSRDPTRIWSGAGAILHMHDRTLLASLVPHLPEIRRQTAGIDLGGALHPNSVHLAHALTRIEHVRDDKGCLCALYNNFDDPGREAGAGRVKVLETVLLDGGPYPDHYFCECQVCGAKWKVIEREYHYTWWGWERI